MLNSMMNTLERMAIMTTIHYIRDVFELLARLAHRTGICTLRKIPPDRNGFKRTGSEVSRLEHIIFSGN
jgi:hypothetical protein